MIQHQPANTPTKICSHKDCNKPLPATVEYFYPDPAKKDGLSYYCRTCSKLTASRNGKARRRAAALRRKVENPNPVPAGYKKCSSCKMILQATSEFFTKRSASADGFGYWCKSCVRGYQNDRYHRGTPSLQLPAQLPDQPLQQAPGPVANAPY